MSSQYTGLDPTVHDTIITAIRAGNFQEQAAQAAGVTPETLSRWIARGRHEAGRLADGKPPKPRAARFLRLYQDVSRARAEAEVGVVAQIRVAAKEDWRAGAFLLTHGTSRKRWRKEQRLELTGADGGPVEVAASPRERIEERLAAMERKLDAASNVVDIAERKVLGE